MVTNIPANMVVDQFGMIGLLTFIRAAETDPNLGKHHLSLFIYLPVHCRQNTGTGIKKLYFYDMVPEKQESFSTLNFILFTKLWPVPPVLIKVKKNRQVLYHVAKFIQLGIDGIRCNYTVPYRYGTGYRYLYLYWIVTKIEIYRYRTRYFKQDFYKEV
jgi:hypothetical protein